MKLVKVNWILFRLSTFDHGRSNICFPSFFFSFPLLMWPSGLIVPSFRVRRERTMTQVSGTCSRSSAPRVWSSWPNSTRIFDGEINCCLFTLFLFAPRGWMLAAGRSGRWTAYLKKERGRRLWGGNVLHLLVKFTILLLILLDFWLCFE